MCHIKRIYQRRANNLWHNLFHFCKRYSVKEQKMQIFIFCLDKWPIKYFFEMIILQYVE